MAGGDLRMANSDAAGENALPSGESPHATHRSRRTVVVKVGGSLLDIPDLVDRLRGALAALATPRIILVVGGGSAAELVRQRSRLDNLGEDKSHWLAIRAMTFNSYLVEALLPNSMVITSLEQSR